MSKSKTNNKRQKLDEGNMNCYEVFWANTKKCKMSQLDRYKLKDAPAYICKFIELGGGTKMGTTCEEFARFKFPVLQKRKSGAHQSGYDHLLKKDDVDLFVEQKSAGRWENGDYKWQHIEPNHKWSFLLLCGIDYTEVKFWVMSRPVFNDLVSEHKITNQGNKEGESNQGMWMWYSDIKDYLIEVTSSDELIQFT